MAIVGVAGHHEFARSVAIETDCNPGPVGTTVVNIETNESVSGPPFQYRTPVPEIGGISPDSTTADVDTGFIVAGSPTTLTMTGAGFDRQGKPPLVAFGSIVSPSVVVTSIDPDPLHEGFGVGDVMSVDIPRFTGAFPEEECEVGGETGSRFAEVLVPMSVTARDTGCTSEGAVVINFAYFPNDTSCRIAPPTPVTPVAEFSFTFNGTEISVTDLSTNAPTSIQWDFGDGAVESGSPGETRMHDYGGGASGSMFDVILSATNSAGTGQITKTVTVP